MQLGEHLDALKAWADPKGLEVRATAGDQHEPEHIVAVANPGGGVVILSRTSMDSIDTAAMYLFNTLQRLGVDLDQPHAGPT